MSAGNENPTPSENSRYSRQILLEHIGPQGQRRIRESAVTLIGCGALGSVAADLLVRAGIGQLRICDRDFIETSNLQRQMLFDEEDIAADLPKAEAAARKLRRVNPEVRIEPVVDDVTYSNIERLSADADLIIDGADNFETRYLINDFAVSTDRPWVYGAVVGTTGLCMSILPGQAACLRCVFEEPPPPELSPTCDTVGVLAPAAHIIASLQITEALKILTGQAEKLFSGLLQLDAWTGRLVIMRVERSPECPCCARREFPFLRGQLGSAATVLCGRQAVQIRPPGDARLDLRAIARRLAPLSSIPVRHNPYLIRAELDGLQLTLFADGRAIFQGTNDPNRARSVHARYIGA
jgi:adenylyltransferase/sulfurtransferase